MNRRKFLKLLSTAGATAGLPMILTPSAYGAEPERFWVVVHAAGGWDPTSLIDPKGDAPRSDGKGPVNRYPASTIKSAGNIQYSPYPEDINTPSIESGGHFDNFFPRHYSRLLVVNGIDNETNSHDTGTRFTWSGKSSEGHPAFGALAAAASAPEQPMAFISNGGYDFTASLVGASRASSANTFMRLAFPNSIYPDHEDYDDKYFETTIYQQVEFARKVRLDRLRQQSSLPYKQLKMQNLDTVRNGDNNLDKIVEALPSEVSSGIRGQAEIATAAFSAGLAVAANLSFGGFDTHGNHDNNHYSRLTQFLEGVDHLWDQIEAHGLQNKTTVIVGSDFGRTPWFNSGNGKDHWTVTSMMAMGAGVQGNRVIGGTNANFEALTVNPTTLQPDANGIKLTPRHMHVALRNLAGIPNELQNQFPVFAESLNIFS